MTDPTDSSAGDDELRPLLARAAGHDPDAWEELYRRLHGPLLRYLGRRIGDTEQAEEAVSETMARAVGAVARFVPGTSPRAWFFGIARNVMREHWRGVSRDRALEERVTGRSVDTTSRPLQEALDADERSRLVLAFEQLSDDDQETLELRIIEEMTAQEVGEVQDRSASAVRTAQARAVRRLRTLIEKGAGHD